jgi:hypothetical protein
MLAGMNALAEHFANDRRRSMIWAIGIAVVLLLAVGGAIAGSVLAAGSPGGPSPEAATLNAAVSNAGNSAGNTATAGKTHRARSGAIARLRRLGGMYGEVAFRGKDGATRTLAFERGVVTSAGPDLVVKAANGTTWTWQFTSSTVVRKGGVKVSRSDLYSDEHVLLAGPVVSGARDARLIVIPGAKKDAAGTPAPAPSASSSASTSSAS